MRGQISHWNAAVPGGVAGGGGGGSAGGFFLEQSFAVASSSWVITHGQGTYGLSVLAFTPSGQPREGAVSYPDPDKVQIDFFHAVTGFARVFD